ncbi:hypothetical protein FRC17_003712 [Serendipita sp. 399]|nr:hypothetical protein FRC17_003712 [Serendipita sp. 399]
MESVKRRWSLLHARHHGVKGSNHPPSPEQQAIVDTLRTHNVTVIARPGSGKTETARFASEANPSWNTLFITYSRHLREGANEKFGHLDHVKVQTIHETIGDLYNVTVNADILLRKLRRIGRYPEWKGMPYDFVIVDEVQDLDPDLFWAVNMILANPNGRPARMLLLGDPYQTIYGYRGADSRYLTEYERLYARSSSGPWKLMNLATSFRLSKHNAALANEYLGQEYIQGTDSGSSPRPLYVVANLSNDKDELGKLVETLEPLVKRYKSDMAILAPSTNDKWGLAQLINTITRQDLGILFATINNDDEFSKSPKALKNKVVVGTFHSFKGSDRRFVTVLQADSSHRDCRPGEPCPNPIFVALTRAKEQLALVQSHTAKIFHGTTEERLRQLTDYKELVECKPGQGKTRTQRTGDISRLVQHLPIDILEEGIKDIFVVDEIRSPHYNGSPLESLIQTSEETYESVGDFNGSALTEALLFKSEDGHSSPPYKFTRKEAQKIAKRVIKKYENMTGFIFRRVQLREKPNWLSSTGLEEVIRRVTEIFDTTSNLRYEYDFEGVVPIGGDEEHMLKGKVDVYEPAIGENSPPTIYELKLKSQISPEDLVQLLFYGILEAINRRPTDPQFPRMILYNAADGQQLQLRAHSFQRALEYLVKVIRHREKSEVPISRPTEEFVNENMSILDEIKDAKPYSGPMEGKWWQWKL